MLVMRVSGLSKRTEEELQRLRYRLGLVATGRGFAGSMDFDDILILFPEDLLANDMGAVVIAVEVLQLSDIVPSIGEKRNRALAGFKKDIDGVMKEAFPEANIAFI